MHFVSLQTLDSQLFVLMFVKKKKMLIFTNPYPHTTCDNIVSNLRCKKSCCIMGIGCDFCVQALPSARCYLSNTDLFVPRLFGEKRGDIVFGIPSFNLPVVGSLSMDIFLQLYSNSFETLQVFRSWSEDLHIVWP